MSCNAIKEFALIRYIFITLADVLLCLENYFLQAHLAGVCACACGGGGGKSVCCVYLQTPKTRLKIFESKPAHFQFNVMT